MEVARIINPRRRRSQREFQPDDQAGGGSAESEHGVRGTDFPRRNPRLFESAGLVASDARSGWVLRSQIGEVRSFVAPNQFVILVAALAAIAPSWGQPVVQAVVNGASYSGNIAPGTWVSIFGTGLSTAIVTAAGVPLQTTLGGVSVTFNGIAAPLSYVSPTQLIAVVPFEIQILPTPSPPVTVPVVVTTSAGSSVPRIISLSRESPGLFTENGAG